MDRKKKKAIRISYILPNLSKGGAERFLLDLIINLDKTKYEVSLILFNGAGEWIKDLDNSGVEIIILKKKHKIDLVNFWQLLTTLKRIKPQIVHTELGGDIYGRLAAKIISTPIIISTEQNLNPDEDFIHNLLKRWTSKWANRIVVIGEAVKKDSQRRYQIPNSKLVIIPNGIDINKFLVNISESRENLNKPKKLIFGTLGRLAPQKGQSVLIKAWKNIENKEAECLIAGSGPLETKLKKEINKLGLKTRVKLIGTINDTPSYFRNLDVFILPSLWEGQGVVLLEAALAGVIIIASEVDGIKEILDQESAYLVPANNVYALSQKIHYLLNNFDSPEIDKKRKKLQNRIINNYDIKKITLKYESLYQKLSEQELHENITG